MHKTVLATAIFFARCLSHPSFSQQHCLLCLSPPFPPPFTFPSLFFTPSLLVLPCTSPSALALPICATRQVPGAESAQRETHTHTCRHGMGYRREAGGLRKGRRMLTESGSGRSRERKTWRAKGERSGNTCSPGRVD